MDRTGTVLESALDPDLSREMITKIYKGMTLLNTMDRVLYGGSFSGSTTARQPFSIKFDMNAKCLHFNVFRISTSRKNQLLYDELWVAVHLSI